MKKHNSILVHALGLLLLAGGNAIAEGGKVVPVDPLPVCTSSITGSVTAGYRTNYIFRGLGFGEDVVLADIEVTAPLSQNLDFVFGAEYFNVIQDNEGLRDAQGFDRLRRVPNGGARLGNRSHLLHPSRSGYYRRQN